MVRSERLPNNYVISEIQIHRKPNWMPNACWIFIFISLLNHPNQNSNHRSNIKTSEYHRKQTPTETAIHKVTSHIHSVFSIMCLSCLSVVKSSWWIWCCRYLTNIDWSTHSRIKLALIVARWWIDRVCIELVRVGIVWIDGSWHLILIPLRIPWSWICSDYRMR